MNGIKKTGAEDGEDLEEFNNSNLEEKYFSNGDVDRGHHIEAEDEDDEAQDGSGVAGQSSTVCFSKRNARSNKPTNNRFKRYNTDDDDDDEDDFV